MLHVVLILFNYVFDFVKVDPLTDDFLDAADFNAGNGEIIANAGVVDIKVERCREYLLSMGSTASNILTSG